jgi:hypothetical protein
VRHTIAADDFLAKAAFTDVFPRWRRFFRVTRPSQPQSCIAADVFLTESLYADEYPL